MFSIKLLEQLYTIFLKVFIALYVNNRRYKAWRFILV